MNQYVVTKAAAKAQLIPSIGQQFSELCDIKDADADHQQQPWRLCACVQQHHAAAAVAGDQSKPPPPPPARGPRVSK